MFRLLNKYNDLVLMCLFFYLTPECKKGSRVEEGKNVIVTRLKDDKCKAKWEHMVW
jgi:hypothetical protein